MFRSELGNLIDLSHPLARLAGEIDWDHFESVFGATYADGVGRPAIPTRLMVSLHYLKFAFDLSDEDVVGLWAENPYWQYLSGMKHFMHELPIDPSSMTRWRKRVGEAGSEELLRETIQAGLRVKVIKPTQLARVNVDTTVQEKHVRYPTDARLYQRARERLVAQAKIDGVVLRQSYERVGKRLLLMQSRYAHAKQFKRARKTTRRLHTFLGRVIRDIERKAVNPSSELRHLLSLSNRLYRQQRSDKGKLYSIHAPEVECIAKGKAHKRFEFGCKASLAATSRGGWLLAAKAFHGNPYDGHTLAATIDQIEKLTGIIPAHAFTDMGYRKHDYQGACIVHVDKRRRGRTPVSLWKWMKRRSAIEPTIGHLKASKRLDRNRLKGMLGDAQNVQFAAAGMNLAKLIKTLRATGHSWTQILGHLRNLLTSYRSQQPLQAAA